MSPGSIQLSVRLSIQLLPEKPQNEISKTVTPGSSHLHKISTYLFQDASTETSKKTLSNWQFRNSILKNIVCVFLKGKCQHVYFSITCYLENGPVYFILKVRKLKRGGVIIFQSYSIGTGSTESEGSELKAHSGPLGPDSCANQMYLILDQVIDWRRPKLSKGLVHK